MKMKPMTMTFAAAVALSLSAGCTSARYSRTENGVEIKASARSLFNRRAISGLMLDAGKDRTGLKVTRSEQEVQSEAIKAFGEMIGTAAGVAAKTAAGK